MLDKNRHTRLGHNNDMDEILTHPFFADLNIEQLLAKQIQAPFVPTVRNERDLRHFD